MLKVAVVVELAVGVKVRLFNAALILATVPENTIEASLVPSPVVKVSPVIPAKETVPLVMLRVMVWSSPSTSAIEIPVMAMLELFSAMVGLDGNVLTGETFEVTTMLELRPRAKSLPVPSTSFAVSCMVSARL